MKFFKRNQKKVKPKVKDESSKNKKEKIKKKVDKKVDKTKSQKGFSFFKSKKKPKKSPDSIKKKKKLPEIKVKKPKKKRQHFSYKQRKHRIKDHIEKAGITLTLPQISKRIFQITILINLIISFYLIYVFSYEFGYTWSKISTWFITLWIFIFLFVLFIIWMLFFVHLDLRMYRRNVEIEEVLPDFLQLTASNIKAGMTIDRALWYAVRPRFGVLAKEVEVVAKETMSGKDLKIALQEMANKYDAKVLRRSISLLIEGIDAGGEIGDLLVRIATNIKETKIIRQEMAANVTTYVIFISFATVVAAPLLFSLSGVLIQVIQGLGTSMSDVSSYANTGMALSFKGAGISYSDFRIFVMFTLFITSFFSASIIAIIKKGDVKSGVKYIPIFIITSLVIYLITQSFLDNMVGLFV